MRSTPFVEAKFEGSIVVFDMKLHKVGKGDVLFNILRLKERTTNRKHGVCRFLSRRVSHIWFSYKRSIQREPVGEINGTVRSPQSIFHL